MNRALARLMLLGVGLSLLLTGEVRGQNGPPPGMEMPPAQAAPDEGQPPPQGTPAAPYEQQAMQPPPADQAPPAGAPTGPMPPPQAQGQGNPDEISFQNFYDALGDQGTWIQTQDYGYVWQPNVQDPSWAPYTEGHWVYTDDGWTWVSDEEWGWATYHYGRWVNLDGVGWCWVPGYTWAPAWVSWRYGDGYCGWAPLPPESFVGIDYSGPDYVVAVGFHIGGDCDAFYGIGAGCYHFVPTNCLGYHSYHGCYVKPYNNYAIINQTRNVTNLNVNRDGPGNGPGGGGHFHGVTVGGPPIAQVDAQTTTHVPRASLVASNRPSGGTLHDQSLALYAPRLHGADNAASFHPTAVSRTVDHATVNRGVDVTRPLAVNSHLNAPQPTYSEIQRAQLAQYNAPARAHVVTPNTEVKPILQTPLTSLKPTTSLTPPSSGTAPSAAGQGQSYYHSGNNHGSNGAGQQGYPQGAPGTAYPSHRNPYYNYPPQSGQETPSVNPYRPTYSNTPATVDPHAPMISPSASLPPRQQSPGPNTAPPQNTTHTQNTAPGSQGNQTPSRGNPYYAPSSGAPQREASTPSQGSSSQGSQNNNNQNSSSQNSSSSGSQQQNGGNSTYTPGNNYPSRQGGGYPSQQGGGYPQQQQSGGGGYHGRH